MFDRGVAVIGLGYIGLPTSAAIAMQGIRVIGVDVNEETVAAVNRGAVPFAEPELDVAVAGAYARGLLSASTEVPVADVYLIAVPTPVDRDKKPDLTHVHRAAESIAPQLTPGAVVILESTCPPGATRDLSVRLAAARPDLKFPTDHPEDPEVFVAHCPERVLPGRIMIELVTNDRVVGGVTPHCAHAAAQIYATFCKGAIHETDDRSAEMTKLVENAYRDVNIAFANELANVCESLGQDVWEVIRLANRHPRVNVLRPGPGVGGHCIAVDPWFLASAAPNDTALIRQARSINDARPQRTVELIARALRDRGGSAACLGLSYKADVDDLRESPALEVVFGLATQMPERELLIVEPNIERLPESLAGLDNVALVSLDEAVARASLLALLVDHKEFRDMDIYRLSEPLLIDTRGVWGRRS